MSRKRHGMSHTPIHDIWCGMNNRCNPNHIHSNRYGKRGISVCEEWAVFENFRDWAFANGYKDGLTIERKDVNGNYCPENCMDSACRASEKSAYNKVGGVPRADNVPC